VLIIFRNEPLLFVHGPPVYNKITITVEESTSVIMLNEEALEVSDVMERKEQEQQDVTQSLEVADPSVIRRIVYLGSPFPRQVYQPLQFVMGDETLTGIIEKIEGETVLIEIDEGEKEFVAVEIGRIEEILWRGSPFVEQ
jgi:hypothetical protein